MPRLVRALGAAPNVRAAAFRQSATEAGVEGLAAAVATSGTAAATLTGLSFIGLDGIAAIARCLLLDAQNGFAIEVGCAKAKKFALAHWLVSGADDGRLFVRCFGGDGIVRENAAGDVLASLTTMVWNALSKSWAGGAAMADASLTRRMTVRLGGAVASAQIGMAGSDGQIEPDPLRLHGLPLAVLALLYRIVETALSRNSAAGSALDRPVTASASRLAGLRGLLERSQLARSRRGGCDIAAGTCRGGGRRLVRQMRGPYVAPLRPTVQAARGGSPLITPLTAGALRA